MLSFQMRMIARIMILAAAVIPFSPSAMAEENFNRGVQAYTAKNYSLARQCLSETVRIFPAFWPGHYYLAHTYLSLGQRDSARKQYEACLSCTPPPGQDVLDACRKAMTALGGKPAPSDSTTAAGSGGSTDGGGAGSATEEKKAEAKETKEAKDEPESYREKERRETIERLRKLCAEKVAKIRQELKQALADGDANSSRWYIDRETGGCVTHMNAEDRAAIELEYQSKISAVQQETEKKIADLR